MTAVMPGHQATPGVVAATRTSAVSAESVTGGAGPGPLLPAPHLPGSGRGLERTPTAHHPFLGWSNARRMIGPVDEPDRTLRV